MNTVTLKSFDQIPLSVVSDDTKAKSIAKYLMDLVVEGALHPWNPVSVKTEHQLFMLAQRCGFLEHKVKTQPLFGGAHMLVKTW